jgi:hypothetical protein
MTKGQCNCGCVTFEADCTVEDVYVCHCSLCARATGSAGIAVTVVPMEQFVWTCNTDSITSWSMPGHDWHSHFCKVCGSPVPGADSATTMYIPVALLISGAEHLKVAHHIYVESRQPWVEIGDNGVQHAEAISTGDTDADN